MKSQNSAYICYLSLFLQVHSYAEKKEGTKMGLGKIIVTDMSATMTLVLCCNPIIFKNTIFFSFFQ